MPEQRERDPYPGPRPFDEDEQDIFFGRDAEIRELVSLVVAHHAVLLYAASGAGKTSLLNAGVIPMLQDHEFEVLPPLRIGTSVEGSSDSGKRNVYTAAVLSNLAEALGQDLPSSLVEALAPPGNPPSSTLRGLVFDQFEELFTTYPESWHQREGFFREIAGLLDKDEHQRARIIVAIREDYLADVDSYAHLVPGALRVRLRLEPLREGAALHAVKDPLRRTRRSFDEGVAEELVHDLLQQRIEQRAVVSSNGAGFVKRFRARLRRTRPHAREIAGEFVEPVQLQVVCRSLWEALPQDVTTIAAEDLKNYGDVDQALGRFYEEALDLAGKTTHIREGKLRSRFEEAFITPRRTRALVFRDERSVDGIPVAAIEVLERRHLIRSVTYAGAPHCELTHDRLIDPILAANDRFASKQQRRAAVAAVVVTVILALAAVLSVLLLLEGSEPGAALNPAVRHFGTAEIGQSKPNLVVFVNGQAPTTNFDVHVAPNRSDFRAPTPQPGDCSRRGTIERGKACVIRLLFEPSGSGEKTAVLRVTYGSGSQLQARLLGTGIRDLRLRLMPKEIDFGRVRFRGIETRDARLRNGATPVKITSYETTKAEFQAISSCSAGQTLAAQETCTFTVTFAPGERPGRRAGELRVHLQRQELTIPLTGYGTGP
jgi:Novel STAND NTPase 1/Cep192 domain 4